MLRYQYLILDTVEWFPVLELVGDSTRTFIVSDDDSETLLDLAHSIYHDNWSGIYKADKLHVCCL